MDDMKNQVLFLQEFAHAKGWMADAVFEDIGSGWNDNRKNGISC
jgi:predicted site-specific integrase-resolvase